MKSLKWILTAFVALNLTACAFDKNSDTDTQDEINDRNSLNEKYNRITGVYSGTFTSTSGDLAIELRFYTVDKKVGETQNGQPKFLPSLMMRYRNIRNPNGDFSDVNLEVRYIEQTSEFYVSTNTNDFGIHGYIRGETVTGDVIRNGGRWGTLKATLTSRGASGDNDANFCAERAARLIRAYQPIVGAYKGQVKMDKNAHNSSFKASIILSITQIADKDCSYTPALLGSLSRDDDPSDNLRLALAVDYKPDAYPPSISLVSTESKADYSATIIATIRDTGNTTVIDGSFSNKLGDMGTAHFEKKN